jgi:hypothetical protein
LLPRGGGASFPPASEAGPNGEDPVGSLTVSGFLNFTTETTCLNVSGNVVVSGGRILTGRDAGSRSGALGNSGRRSRASIDPYLDGDSPAVPPYDRPAARIARRLLRCPWARTTLPPRIQRIDAQPPSNEISVVRK